MLEICYKNCEMCSGESIACIVTVTCSIRSCASHFSRMMIGKWKEMKCNELLSVFARDVHHSYLGHELLRVAGDN
jgi:hypothetical protein